MLRTLAWRELALRFLDSYNPKLEKSIVVANAIVDFETNLIGNTWRPLRYHAHDFVVSAVTAIEHNGPVIGESPTDRWLRQWLSDNWPTATQAAEPALGSAAADGASAAGTCSDPICGNCGKPLSAHQVDGDEIFCFSHTNGDLFTDEPHDTELVRYLEKTYPGLHARLLAEWRRANGHPPEGA